jgi:D-alanyl-D-alanine carboxypeptidase
MKKFLLCSILLINSLIYFGQKTNASESLQRGIDSLLALSREPGFNGTVLISQRKKTLYSSCVGYADLNHSRKIEQNNQFVIGSLSKQITAALVLREVEKDSLDLHVPIRKYLPDFKASWADTITVDYLLTHKDGIIAFDQPLQFRPGSQFKYNQINFELLAMILEQVTKKSFAALSRELFLELKMKDSFHPDNKGYDHLASGITRNKDGIFKEVKESYRTNYTAAGGFISTAVDLEKWNKALHSGQILGPKYYNLMLIKKPRAIRDHPLFSLTEYGYGITIKTDDNLLQLGQTGYSEGFSSMNFYFPETGTSVVVLQNITSDPDDLKKTFYYQLEVLRLVRNYLIHTN